MTDVNQLITDHLDIWTTATEKKSSAGRGIGGVSLYGVKKLRELILELAVRGKLLEEGETEERGPKVPKAAKRKKTSHPDEKKLEFIPLPNWTSAKFGEFFDLEYGDNLPKTKRSETGEVPVYGSNGIVGTHREACVFSPCIVVGRKGSAGALNFCLDEACWVTDVAYSCVPPADIDLQFAMVLFSTLGLENLGKGIKPGLSRNEAYALPIAVPPLAEQYRIVAKVDELMGLCDALERQAEDNLEAHQTLVETCLATLTNSQSPEDLTQNWTRIEAHFDTLFTTEDSLSSLWNIILKLAVRGSLVPQNGTEESASQILRSIAIKKEVLISEGRLRKSKALKVINEDEAPFTLPIGWAWARLNDFIDVRDGTHDSPKDANGTNTFPIVTSKNFKNGEIDFDSARRISAADHFEISRRSRVERDDILFSMIGGNLGNQVMVRTDEDFSVKNVALFKYYDKTQSIPEFVKLYMENLAVDLQSQASGGAQPFVSLGFLRNLMIGVPPIDEQERIVAKARELERLIQLTRDKISVSTASSVALADTLTSKIH